MTDKTLFDRYPVSNDLQVVLNSRLCSMLRLLNNQNQVYPFKAVVLGFPAMIVKDRDELMCRIRELCDVLGFEMVKDVDYPDELKNMAVML